MQSLTSRSSNRRRFMRLAGTGATALLAATAVASAAGAATTPANAPIGATGSVASLSGSSMEVQNASTGQTTVNWSTTTTFSKTVTEAVNALASGDCVTVSGTPSNKSKTTIAGAHHHREHGQFLGIVHVGRSHRWRRGQAAGSPAVVASAPAVRPARRRRRQRRGRRTRPSFGGSGSSNFRKALANLAIASGKVTGVSGSTVTVSGISISPGSFARGATKSSSTTEEAHRAQDEDGDAQDHDVEHDLGQRHPDRGVDRPRRR